MSVIDSFAGDNEFLSNFYICAVAYEDVLYSTAEHAYQAAKTLDLAERAAIHQASSPDRAKKMGQRVTLREDWNRIKLDVMYQVVKDKFTRNPVLKALLLGTGDAELIEGNWWGDTFWGVCKGQGTNHLGKTLMRVRSELGGHI